MSTGGSLPYQLRPNKAVERLIFIELLSRLDPILDISSQYDYIGFGGPQMEDFRLMYERFPEMPMVSLEREEEVRKRQKFNGPHTNVKCKLQSSDEFVNSFAAKRKAIIWLDYTSPSERPGQIEEFQTLLQRAKEYSIIKITMNSSAASLGGDKGSGLQAERRNRFLRDFGRCFPNGLQEADVTHQRFPSTLLKVVEYAASEALRDRPDWRFQPLSSTVYADGQPMLTVTGLVAKRPNVENMLVATKLPQWDYCRLQWDSPVEIEVPELTLKERIYVNQLLPKYQDDVAAIQRKIGFLIDQDERVSQDKLRNYISFYKHYPHFGKIAF